MGTAVFLLLFAALCGWALKLYFDEKKRKERVQRLKDGPDKNSSAYRRMISQAGGRAAYEKRIQESRIDKKDEEEIEKNECLSQITELLASEGLDSLQDLLTPYKTLLKARELRDIRFELKRYFVSCAQNGDQVNKVIASEVLTTAIAGYLEIPAKGDPLYQPDELIEGSQEWLNALDHPLGERKEIRAVRQEYMRLKRVENEKQIDELESYEAERQLREEELKKYIAEWEVKRKNALQVKNVTTNQTDKSIAMSNDPLYKPGELTVGSQEWLSALDYPEKDRQEIQANREAFMRRESLKLQESQRWDNESKKYITDWKDKRKDALQAADAITTQADKFIHTLKEIIHKHRFALASERKRLVKVDAYGKEDSSRWICQELLDSLASFPMDWEEKMSYEGYMEEGIGYFFRTVISEEYSSYSERSSSESMFCRDWISFASVATKSINGCDEMMMPEDWFATIVNLVEEELKSVRFVASGQNIDDMTGIEYEELCKEILVKDGWKVDGTSVSGDQGVDLIASKDDLRVCIQCKRYSKPVGNSAVQEVVSGMVYWQGTHACVVTNAGYTKSAKQLAEANNVVLMETEALSDLYRLIKSE